jgi:hypothetical protein
MHVVFGGGGDDESQVQESYELELRAQPVDAGCSNWTISIVAGPII